MKWYVLQVRTGEEISIRNCIKKIGIESLVPQRALIERRQGKPYQVIKTVFPSYVFVRITFEPKIYYQLLRVTGVIRFLGYGDGPAPVPENQMCVVLKWSPSTEPVKVSTVTIEEGKTIKIIDGPLKNMEGQILHLDRRKQRAKVKVTILNHAHYVDMGVELLSD